MKYTIDLLYDLAYKLYYFNFVLKLIRLTFILKKIMKNLFSCNNNKNRIITQKFQNI